jgi:hypothetical protein
MTDSHDAVEPRLAFDDPATLDALLGLVAEGKHSLADIAKTLCVPRRDVAAWLTLSDENQARYTRAIALGDSARRERILSELEGIAFADPVECFGANGALLPLHMMPINARKVVQEFKVKTRHRDQKDPAVDPDGQSVTGTTYEVKMYNRLDALKLLGTELRMFTETHEHKVLDNPYKAVPIPVTQRLPDPDLAGPATEAQFTDISPLT